MIYTHVLNNGRCPVRSPLDQMVGSAPCCIAALRNLTWARSARRLRRNCPLPSGLRYQRRYSTSRDTLHMLQCLQD
jgi:hypothetical protein